MARGSSDLFLRHAVERVAARGGTVAHIDATLICERPKVGPHRDAIRAKNRRDHGLAARPRGGEGDDLGATRLYRARRGHRGAGDGDRAAALKDFVRDGDFLTRACAFTSREANTTDGGDEMRDEIVILAQRMLDACLARKLKIATAESCTGGLIAGALTENAGSSNVFERGFVTYSNEAKQEMLGVPAATARRAWRGLGGGRRGHGARRAGTFARPNRSVGHRNRRAGRRFGGKAGRAGAFRPRADRAPDPAGAQAFHQRAGKALSRAEIRRQAVLTGLHMLLEAAAPQLRA